MKIDRRVYRYIEYEMYHYLDYKNEIQQVRADIIHRSPLPPDGMPKGSTMGDSTSKKALALVTSAGIASMEKTVNAIDKAIASLTERHRKIFEMLYVQGRKDRYRICDEIHISERSFQYNKIELIQAVGFELGVIKEI